MKRVRIRIQVSSIIVIVLFMIGVFLWNYKKVITDRDIKEVNAERLDIIPKYENLENLQFDSEGHL